MTAARAQPAIDGAAPSVLAAALPEPALQVLPVPALSATPQNPRRAPETGLAELVASLATVTEPYLAQPPLVEQIGDQAFRVIAGERRLRAVTAAGWTTLACLVYPALDPAQAYRLRLVENLQRRALDVLDEASAIKIAFLLANAEARGAGAAARAILAVAQAPPETITQLHTLLDATGFAPTRPAVTWDQVLDTLGLDLSRGQRKRRLRLLALTPTVQAQAQALQMSEAAMRALGTLPPEQQQHLLDELTAAPGLVPKVRRIASTVTDGSYTLEAALDEARGRVRLAPADGTSGPGDHGDHGADPVAAAAGSADAEPDGASAEPDQALIDAIMELISVASQVTAAATTLTTTLGQRQIAELGAPWGPYATYALTAIRQAIQELPA